MLIYGSLSLCKPGAKERRENLAECLAEKDLEACKKIVAEVMASDGTLETPYAAGYLLCFAVIGPRSQPCAQLIAKLDQLDPNIKVHYCPAAPNR